MTARASNTTATRIDGTAAFFIAHLGVPTWCLEPGLACRNRLLVGLLLGGLYGEASLGHALLKLLGLDLGV